MKIVMQADDFGRSHEMNLAIDCAMKQGLVRSTALLMGSEFTREAVEMAQQGGYLRHVHCHLNLSSGKTSGNHFVPLNENYKKSRFCKNGEFSGYNYYKPDFAKYSDVFLQELETQFLQFRELTGGQANYNHLDVHRWVNLSPPVDLAYRKLIRKYDVASARFFGEHQKSQTSLKKKLFYSMMFFNIKREKQYVMKSSKVPYFLQCPDQFAGDSIVELYVHPDYQNGVLVDATTSPFEKNAPFKPLEEQIRLIREAGHTEFLSWEDL